MIAASSARRRALRRRRRRRAARCACSADHGARHDVLATDGVIAVQRGARLHPAPHHPPRRPARPPLGLETPFLGELHEVVHRAAGRRRTRTSCSTATMSGGCSRPRRSASPARSTTGSRLLDEVIGARPRRGASEPSTAERRVPAARHLRLPRRDDGRDRRARPGWPSTATGFETHMERAAQRARAAARRRARDAERVAALRARGAGAPSSSATTTLATSTRRSIAAEDARRRPHARQARALAVLPRGRRPGVGPRRDRPRGAVRGRSRRSTASTATRRCVVRSSGELAAGDDACVRGSTQPRRRADDGQPHRHAPAARARCATVLGEHVAPGAARPCAPRSCASTSPTDGR